MKNIKRVLCIVSVMNAGGAETFLMKIYRNLDRSKYQMDFCVNKKEKGFYDDEIKKMGGKIYIIPCKSENIKEFRKGLSNIISQNKYVYVLRITSNAMGFYDLKIAKDNGAEKCIARSSNSSDGKGIKVRLAHMFGRLLYSRYVDVKIAPSDLAAQYTFGKKEYKKGNVSILHNAVDLDQYCYSVLGREKIRKEFNIETNTLVVGHIGRFSKQKNHMFLLEIFRKIHDIYPNARLMLVGKGELQKEVEARAEILGLRKSVIFTGVRSDIANLLSAMDVFVFPSLYEGMPNTVIEAQATGLPCVIADTITREANITGLVHYESLTKTSDKWADIAIKCSRKKRKNVREEFVKNGYDINSVVREFEKLIFENRGISKR